MILATKIRVYGFGMGLLAATLASSACGGGGTTNVGGDTGTGAGSDTTAGAGGGTTTNGAGGDTSTGAGGDISAGAGAGGETSTSSSSGTSSSGCTSANIVGSWEAVGGANGAIVTLTFNDDDTTYMLGVFTEPTAGMFDEEQETGTYAVSVLNSVSYVTLKPGQLTCPTLAPPQIYACAVGGGNLFLAANGTTSLWTSNPPPPPPNPTLGCFGSGGVFTPYP